MDIPSAATTPATATSIARITRGGVAGGQPATIVVDAGIEHKLEGATRVRLRDVPEIPGVNERRLDCTAL